MATVILKVTERCNSNCAYCDVVRRKAGETMSLDVLDVVLQRIDEYLRNNARDTIEVIWHGGEPLLVGADYFRAAAEMQQRRCAATVERIRHSLQTNLTLVSDELVASLRPLGITAVGTSFEPVPGIRGRGEPIDSKWYTERFLRGLRLLDAHQIHWGMIYVVTQRSLARPLELFHFLTNLSLQGSITFNPVLLYGDQGRDLAVTPREYVEFLGAIFPTWWAHRERYQGVQPFRALVDNIIHRQTSLGCVDSGSCSYNHVNVAPSGETSQCGRSDDWGLLRYGNIADRPLEAILHDDQRRQLEQRQVELKKGPCGECRFWDLCHGGCPLDAWSKHASFAFETEWCEARRGLIEDVFEPVTSVRYEPAAPGRG